MKWQEVRRLYPDQYVKLNILDFYIKNNKKVVTNVTLINVIEDSKTATKELLRTKDDMIVYHTGAEKNNCIIICLYNHLYITENNRLYVF